jgi:hypothetical protein
MKDRKVVPFTKAQLARIRNMERAQIEISTQF